MRIDRDQDYPVGSLGAEVLRSCDEADAACPGIGDLLLTDWNARWELAAEDGLRTAWQATA